MDMGQSQLQSLHFLVAEADPVQRRALIEALGQVGATRVTDVPDGPMALRTLQASFTPKVDVAIIDLDLGGMDGLELLRAIAALKSTVRLIVVGAQPASVLFSVESLAQAHGVDLLGTIAKPVTSTKLKALLDNYQPPGRPAPPVPGPSFSFAEVGVFWQLLARDLERAGGAFAGLAKRRIAARHLGDLAAAGKGELIVVA